MTSTECFAVRGSGVKFQPPGPPRVHSSQPPPWAPRDPFFFYDASYFFGQLTRFRPVDSGLSVRPRFSPRGQLSTLVPGLAYGPSLCLGSSSGFLRQAPCPPPRGGQRSGSIGLPPLRPLVPYGSDGWWLSCLFHDAAVPAFILGRIFSVQQPSLLCHFPRVLRVQVTFLPAFVGSTYLSTFLSSPPSSLHVLSPPSVLKFTYFSVFFGSTCLST